MNLHDITLEELLELEKMPIDLPDPVTEYPKGILSVKDNTWKGLARQFVGEMFPLETYHGGSQIRNYLDPAFFGSHHGLEQGWGAYVANTPGRAKNYGNAISKFYINRNLPYVNIWENPKLGDDIYKYTSELPFFSKDGMQRDTTEQAKRISEYLNKKGYAGEIAKRGKDKFDIVVFNSDLLKPANTLWQRFVNRIPTQTISTIGQKLMGYPLVRGGLNFINRATVPTMIYQGLSQPVAKDEDYFLKGGVEYNDYQY